jgi:hypothetical protein
MQGQRFRNRQKKANGKFKYNESYIASYLSGDKPPPPEPDKGVDAKEWERRQIEGGNVVRFHSPQ